MEPEFIVGWMSGSIVFLVLVDTYLQDNNYFNSKYTQEWVFFG